MFHQELKESWQRLRTLALNRQEKLFGAHEIQRFNRDADETVAWITEKDVVLSSDDFGRDLASVQTLQVNSIQYLSISINFNQLQSILINFNQY